MSKFLTDLFGLIFIGVSVPVLFIFGGAFAIGIIYPDMCASGNCYTSSVFQFFGFISIMSLELLLTGILLNNFEVKESEDAYNGNK